MAKKGDKKSNTTAAAKTKAKPAPQLAPAFCQTPPGLLNPHLTYDSPEVRIDPRDTSRNNLALLRNSIKKQMGIDLLSNPGPMRAEVLMITKDLSDTQSARSSDSWLSNMMNIGAKQAGDKPQYIEMRVRIPEIHGRVCPEIQGVNDVESFLFYPTVISQDTLVASQTYKPGDFVVVTFDNLKTFSGGQLIGPFISSIPAGSQTVCVQAVANATTTGQGNSGKQNASGHTGAKGAALQARDERKAVAFIGTGGMSSVFGKTLQKWFYSKGYAIIGPQGISPKQKDNPDLTQDFRHSSPGSPLFDLVLSKESAAAKKTVEILKKKPEIVVVQFDEFHKTLLSVEKKSETDLIRKTVQEIKSITNVQKIILIGTVDSTGLSMSTVTNKQYKKDDSGTVTTPNQLWMSSTNLWGSQTPASGKGAFKNVIAADPFGKWIGDPKAPDSPRKADMAKWVINNHLAKIIETVKGPSENPKKPKSRPKKSAKLQKYLSGFVHKITNFSEAKAYIMQIATRLNYSTTDKPPTTGEKHWRKDLLDRNSSTAGKPLTNKELSTILGLASPPNTPGYTEKPKEEQFYSPPTPPASTSGALPFPDEATSAQLKERLGLQITQAADFVKKKEKDKEEKEAQQAPGTASAAAADCPPGTAVTGAGRLPALSTYKGPKTLKKISLQGRIRNRPGKVHSVLTIWPSLQHFKKQEGALWKQALDGFDALSEKLINGKSKVNSYSKKLENLKLAASMGLAKHAWGYHYCRTIKDATVEARLAAKVCNENNISVYYWNAEKQWAGMWGEPVAASPDPPGAAMQFAYIFKKLAKNTALIANCIMGTSRFPDQCIAAYDGYSVMTYGTQPNTIYKRWLKHKPRAQKMGTPFCPMPSTGRISRKNGRVWGFSNDEKQKGKMVPGILSMAKDPATKPHWVCFYYGSGSGPIASKGNAANPPLSKTAEALRKGTPAPIPTGGGKRPKVGAIKCAPGDVRPICHPPKKEIAKKKDKPKEEKKKT